METAEEMLHGTSEHGAQEGEEEEGLSEAPQGAPEGDDRGGEEEEMRGPLLRLKAKVSGAPRRPRPAGRRACGPRPETSAFTRGWFETRVFRSEAAGFSRRYSGPSGPGTRRDRLPGGPAGEGTAWKAGASTLPDGDSDDPTLNPAWLEGLQLHHEIEHHQGRRSRASPRQRQARHEPDAHGARGGEVGAEAAGQQHLQVVVVQPLDCRDRTGY